MPHALQILPDELYLHLSYRKANKMWMKFIYIRYKIISIIKDKQLS